ncbi:MAG: thioredoxin domain-containing protein, partial [Planctomycetes bacterium]|nr:thioredoxin domain-containing protein [Planctomycetota bacterium]
MTAPDRRPETNRLVREQSPYLLQHAHNPVDWYPWEPEAFAAAAARDVPIFLSVGYSTCHWCHVMAHESFENLAIARLLNEHFVPVKVDREERPDIDEMYLGATQVLTGHGGWPNSVWLTPDRRPFFAGTYFPPEDRPDRPGFPTVLRRIAAWWATERRHVEAQADEVTDALRRMAGGSHMAGSGRAGRERVAAALAELRRTFDPRHGGFGTRPKFPPHGALALLLHEFELTGDRELLGMVTRTLDGLRLGGIHDHVGGGFARYATDERWFLPHFEKMLYDNAQLARAYVDAWRLTGTEDYRRAAERTFMWVLREMRHGEGAFYSAWDADSEGEEGKFYLWRRAEVREALGTAEGELFCRVYGVSEAGNYCEEATGRRPGTNIVYLEQPLEATAAREGLAPAALQARMDDALEKLRAVRSRRVRPHLDDKVLASWNGLMIGSLAHGGRVLGEPRYVAAAAAAARFVLAHLRAGGRLRRSWRAGEAKLNAYLDDHVFLAHGLLDLHEATGEAVWR